MSTASNSAVHNTSPPLYCVQLSGVVAYISAKDIPRGGKNEVYDDVLFAEGSVHYVGQRLGLIIASSQVTSPH